MGAGDQDLGPVWNSCQLARGGSAYSGSPALLGCMRWLPPIPGWKGRSGCFPARHLQDTGHQASVSQGPISSLPRVHWVIEPHKEEAFIKAEVQTRQRPALGSARRRGRLWPAAGAMVAFWLLLSEQRGQEGRAPPGGKVGKDTAPRATEEEEWRRRGGERVWDGGSGGPGSRTGWSPDPG